MSWRSHTLHQEREIRSAGPPSLPFAKCCITRNTMMVACFVVTDAYVPKSGCWKPRKSITVRRSKNNPDDGRSSHYRCRLILVIENLVDLIIHIKTPSQRNYGMRSGGDGQVESGGKGVDGPCGETISLWTDSKMLPSSRRK